VTKPLTKPWNPSRGTRIAIAAATLWEWLYVAIFLTMMGGLWFLALTKRSVPAKGFGPVFGLIFPLHCLTMVLSFVLIAVYLRHAATNDRLTQEQRIAWILVLFFANMLAFPVYWWLYLKPARPPQP